MNSDIDPTLFLLFVTGKTLLPTALIDQVHLSKFQRAYKKTFLFYIFYVFLTAGACVFYNFYSSLTL